MNNFWEINVSLVIVLEENKFSHSFLASDPTREREREMERPVRTCRVMLAVGPLSGLQEYSPESEYLNTSLTIVFKLPYTPGGDDDQLDRGDLGLVHDERDARPRSPE